MAIRFYGVWGFFKNIYWGFGDNVVFEKVSHV
jgi:hypothetical protein